MPVFLLPILGGLSKVMRIPAIAAFIAGFAGQLVAWFSKFMARGVALNLAVIAVIVALALGISTAFLVMIEGISYVLPPEFSQGMGFITPSNAVPCLSTIAAARIARWVWEWQVYAIHKVTG